MKPHQTAICLYAKTVCATAPFSNFGLCSALFFWRWKANDRVADVKEMMSQDIFFSVISVEQQDGWTACHYATSAGSVEIVELLALHGANINAQTNRSRSTPLHLAAKRSKKLKFIRHKRWRFCHLAINTTSWKRIWLFFQALVYLFSEVITRLWARYLITMRTSQLRTHTVYTRYD